MVFHAMDGPLTSAAYHGHPGESYVRVAVIDYGGGPRGPTPYTTRGERCSYTSTPRNVLTRTPTMKLSAETPRLIPAISANCFRKLRSWATET